MHSNVELPLIGVTIFIVEFHGQVDLGSGIISQQEFLPRAHQFAANRPRIFHLAGRAVVLVQHDGCDIARDAAIRHVNFGIVVLCRLDAASDQAVLGIEALLDVRTPLAGPDFVFRLRLQVVESIHAKDFRIAHHPHFCVVLVDVLHALICVILEELFVGDLDIVATDFHVILAKRQFFKRRAGVRLFVHEFVVVTLDPQLDGACIEFRSNINNSKSIADWEIVTTRFTGLYDLIGVTFQLLQCKPIPFIIHLNRRAIRQAAQAQLARREDDEVAVFTGHIEGQFAAQLFAFHIFGQLDALTVFSTQVSVQHPDAKADIRLVVPVRHDAHHIAHLLGGRQGRGQAAGQEPVIPGNGADRPVRIDRTPRVRVKDGQAGELVDPLQVIDDTRAQRHVVDLVVHRDREAHNMTVGIEPRIHGRIDAQQGGHGELRLAVVVIVQEVQIAIAIHHPFVVGGD